MLQEVIETKLHNAFQPDYLKVLNESYMHNVAPGSESHFKVIVVSETLCRTTFDCASSFSQSGSDGRAL